MGCLGTSGHACLGVELPVELCLIIILLAYPSGHAVCVCVRVCVCEHLLPDTQCGLLAVLTWLLLHSSLWKRQLGTSQICTSSVSVKLSLRFAHIQTTILFTRTRTAHSEHDQHIVQCTRTLQNNVLFRSVTQLQPQRSTIHSHFLCFRRVPRISQILRGLFQRP